MEHEQKWYMKFWVKLLKGSNVLVPSSFHAGWNKDESGRKWSHSVVSDSLWSHGL